MDFQGLRDRLVEHLRERVRSGELTERGIARVTGVSQPHIHNALKGKRILSPELCDEILHHLHMDVLDLLTHEDVFGRRSRNT